VPCDLLVGDHALGITLAHELEDGLTVQLGCLGARASLEVVGEPACGGVCFLAEWAADIASTVDFGVEMLS